MAGETAEIGTGRTGGREATTGVIPGRIALSVGCPDFTPPKGWQWTSLSSVAQLESGHTPSRKNPEYWDGGIPWIGIKDATENHGRTLSDTYQHVSELGLDNSSARLLPANTVCLSRTASVGFVVVMGRPMATSQDFVNWICGPNIEPHYLKYVLLAENEALWRFASGTTHQTIYYPEAKAFHVCLPPLAEQKAIAAVLGALDDKIELNRRMNATLEAMARALFQSWFVDFDPVRANMDRRDRWMERSEVNRDGRPPAALFPEHLEDSPLGHVPHGWEVKTLGEVIELAYGKPLKAEDRKNGPVCVYGANGPVGWHDEKLVSGPGIVVGRKGNPGVVTWAHGDFYPIDTTFYVEPKGECRSLYFLFYALANHDLANLSADSAVPGLNRNHAYMSKQVIPPALLIEAFDRQVAPIFATIHANEIQSRTLATLRDTLLPKLLSGELSVADTGNLIQTAN